MDMGLSSDLVHALRGTWLLVASYRWASSVVRASRESGRYGKHSLCPPRRRLDDIEQVSDDLC